MKWTLAILAFLGLAAPLRAETTYANAQLQAAVDVLLFSAYGNDGKNGQEGSEKETYPMELHWSGNVNGQSFNFQLLCAQNVLESVWSRATTSFVRFTIGSDIVSRCPNLPIWARVTANNIPDLYLQVLDYVHADRPAKTTPALGTNCMGYTRLLKLNEYESIAPVANGSFGATCTSTGMTPQSLTCFSNAIQEGNSCRLGRSCGNTPHGSIYATTDGCKPNGIQVFYTSTCNDGTFSPAVRSQTACNPSGGTL